MEKLLELVLEKITPAEKEIAEEKKFASGIAEKIRGMEGRHESAEIVGSIARNTHLRGDRDIDIFVLFPQSVSRAEFEREGLRIGKAVFKGHKWEKAYSEHPYIRGVIKGFKVEVVPAYRILHAELLQSAVDRSVFHNSFILENLPKNGEKDVRLLKQFMKGVKCYGADLSSNGFPGYVAELLVIEYGSFRKCIEAVAQWRKGQAIDVEKHYKDGEAGKFFGSHLIVVDPVDKKRNVAAALSLNQYARFIAAGRAFLKKPSMNFFFPKKHEALPKAKLGKFLKKTELAAVRMGYPPKVVEDVMWGQLRRFSKKVSALAEKEDFTVKRGAEWLEEGKMLIVLLEVESPNLQKVKIVRGPEATDTKNSEAFLKAHARPFSGPRIEEGRWVVEVERKNTELNVFLKGMLKMFRKQEREGIRKALKLGAKIMGEKEIAALYSENRGFQQFLTAYLKGKEEFLDY